MERVIRKQKDRCIVAETTGDTDGFTAASIKLKQQERVYKDFSEKAELYTQNERTQVYGFDRSVSQKAIAANKKDYNHYAQLLGKENLPKTHAEFDEMRYNKSEDYLKLKKDFEKRLKSASYEDVSNIKGGLNSYDARIWYKGQLNRIPNAIDRSV